MLGNKPIPISRLYTPHGEALIPDYFGRLTMDEPCTPPNNEPASQESPHRKVSQAQAAPHAADEQFALLVESVVDYAIFLLDTQGNITTWNRGAKRIKGYAADEIIGKHFSIFYPPEDIARNHPQEELAIALQEGRYEEEGWRLRKNGSRFLANVVITALFDENGVHRGFAKVTRDITERKRAEEERLHRMQEATSRVFLREILYSVTEGRLRFCEDFADLPAKLPVRIGEQPVMRSTLSAVRRSVIKTADGLNFPQDRLQDLLTAVSEAAANAAVHASTASCEICASGSGPDAKIQVWISDHGTGIALSHLHRATLERGFTTGGTLGHGFWIMLSTCDRIWLWTRPTGTIVVLEQDASPPEPQWMRSQAALMRGEPAAPPE